MPAINRILFPVSLSERSRGAARYVEAFVGWFEAELMLLHVVANGTNTLARELKPTSQTQLDEFLTDEFKYFTTHRVPAAATGATAQAGRLGRNHRLDPGRRQGPRQETAAHG